MKPFKFFQKNTLPGVNLETVYREVQMLVRGPEYIPPGMVYAPIANEEYEDWRAHMDNLPLGQCPYDIRTLEREHWMTGWSNREDAMNL